MANQGERWSKEKAQAWHASRKRLKGFNFLPNTSINSIEMFQEDTFDPAAIKSDFTYSQALGFDTARVFLSHTLWKDQAESYKANFARYLEIADAANISTMPTFFDDCAFSLREPSVGDQGEPKPGVTNSGWVPSPGLALVEDRSVWDSLEAYVHDFVGAFGEDERVCVWDVYNEPGNSDMGLRSLELLKAAHGWVREAGPSQPITSGSWNFDGSLDEMNAVHYAQSDVISFHGYTANPDIRALLEQLAAFERPILCTEWLNRHLGNTFEEILPLFEEYEVHWWIWGLVNGRSQTHYPWARLLGKVDDSVWQHDLYHQDGTPYDADELELVKRYT